MTGPARLPADPDPPAAMMAGVWLALALFAVGAANLWPLDIVSLEAWPPRLAAMLDQRMDAGTVRAAAVWLALGALAAAALAGVGRWALRLALAGALVAAAIAIETVQVVAAARHPGLADGLLAGGIAALAVLVLRPGGAGLARWFWAMSALALAVILVLLPALGISAAARTPLANWSTGFPLVAGAEGNGDRAWRGEIDELAIFARPLGSDALAILSAAPDALSQAAVREALDGALFSFDEPVTGAQSPLLSGADANALVEAVQAGGGFSVLLTASPEAAFQPGQPRILTLSPDPFRRNVTIGQQGADLFVRIRTPWSGTNGLRQGLSVWPNVFAGGGPRRIAVSHDGRRVEVFVNGQRAGGPVSLYRPRLDLGHDGPAGDLVLMVLVGGACGALAGALASTIGGWLSLAALAPGLVAQLAFGPPDGAAWTLMLVLAGAGAAIAGLGLSGLVRQVTGARPGRMEEGSR